MLAAVKAPASARAAKSKKPRETGPAIEEGSPVAASASNRPPKAVWERIRVVHDSAALGAPAAASPTLEVPQSLNIPGGEPPPKHEPVCRWPSGCRHRSRKGLHAGGPLKVS